MTDLNQVVTEAARLYALAEQAVDHQLGLVASAMPLSPHTPVASVAAPTPAPGAISHTQSLASQQPVRTTRPFQRRIAPVTDAQLRLINRLILDTKTEPGAVLHHYGVGAMTSLSCKDGAGLIDELKTRQVGGARI